MLRVGLTGGMACGKSAVAEMFAREGAQVIQADHIAHQLMLPGQPVYDAVVRTFGRDIVQADGAIDRAKLAEKAFGGSSRVQELNRLVHPAVIAEQEKWMAQQAAQNPKGVAIVEAALILEAGVGRRFDKIVVVTCTPEQCLRRFAVRTKLSLEQAKLEIERRMAAQMSSAEKAKSADFVIDNSGSFSATFEQVHEVHQQLLAEAAKTAAAG